MVILANPKDADVIGLGVLPGIRCSNSSQIFVMCRQVT